MMILTPINTTTIPTTIPAIAEQINTNWVCDNLSINFKSHFKSIWISIFKYNKYKQIDLSISQMISINRVWILFWCASVFENIVCVPPDERPSFEDRVWDKKLFHFIQTNKFDQK
jgi:hypothetical protein